MFLYLFLIFFQIEVTSHGGLTNEEIKIISKVIPKVYYTYKDDLFSKALADTLDKKLPGNNWQVMHVVSSFALSSKRYAYILIDNSFSILIYK